MVRHQKIPRQLLRLTLTDQACLPNSRGPNKSLLTTYMPRETCHGPFLNITCNLQVIWINLASVRARTEPRRRSGCPVSIGLEKFGDRWSLLVIRDLMVRGFRTFKEFQESGEGIASNILTDRLQRLQAAGIITAEEDRTDGRRANYRLTEKGIDLAPVLLELLIWGARHENTAAPCAVIEKMASNRQQVLSEVRRRWLERDLSPFLPAFSERNSEQTRRRGKVKANPNFTKN